MRFSFILVAVMSVGMGSQTPVVPAKSAAAVENSGKAELLDINTATVEQLRALPGMGEVYVRRMVAGRPYTAKNQLVTKGVIPQQEYERIQGRIVARRSQK